MSENKFIRQVAYKVWIKELTTGIYKIKDGFEPNYVLTYSNKEVSRANIIATIISKYINKDKTYGTITIDDGSSNIVIRAFKDDISMLDNLKIGNLILLIGRPKLGLNNEIFISPEIIKILKDINWLKLRKLELIKLSGKPEEILEKKLNKKEPKQEIIEEELVLQENSRQKILNSIDKLDTENGADFIQVIINSGLPEQEAELAIQELLKDGEIFELRAGKLKLTE